MDHSDNLVGVVYFTTKGNMSKINVEIRKVTPQWAEQVLMQHQKRVDEGKFRQRLVSDRVVRKYASDMVAGNWVVTGQGLSFDEDGNVMDGQHRLWAVVKANVPVMMLVTTGIPVVGGDSGRTRSMDGLDIGRARTLSQQLAIEGLKYYESYAVLARNMAILCTSMTARMVSTPQARDIIRMFEKDFDATFELLSENRRRGSAPGYLTAPIVLMRTFDSESSDRFTSQFNDLTNLPKGSPVLALHRVFSRPVARQAGYATGKQNLIATCTALRAFGSDQKVDNIRGDQEAVDWLLSRAKGPVKKVREIVGAWTKVDDLRK